MTDATRRLIQNLRPALREFTVEQLYELARGLADHLAERGIDAVPEARALQCALLPLAQEFHRAIFSADCSTDPWWCESCRAVHAPLAHQRATAAE